jgi:hypothetical protein
MCLYGFGDAGGASGSRGLTHLAHWEPSPVPLWIILLKLLDMTTGPNDGKGAIALRIVMAIIITGIIIYVNIKDVIDI